MNDNDFPYSDDIQEMEHFEALDNHLTDNGERDYYTQHDYMDEPDWNPDTEGEYENN